MSSSGMSALSGWSLLSFTLGFHLRAFLLGRDTLSNRLPLLGDSPTFLLETRRSLRGAVFLFGWGFGAVIPGKDSVLCFRSSADWSARYFPYLA